HFAMDYLVQANRKAAGEESKGYGFIDVKGKKVIVIGGGDTGADCIGTANREGASCVVQIEVLVRPPECRTEEHPWPRHPLLLKTSTSHEEGAERHWAVLTKKFLGAGGKVKGISCMKADFSEKDSKGCPVLREIPGSGFEISADIVILAIGFLHPEKKGLLETLGLELDGRGNIKTDKHFMTSVSGIFSAGDCRRGQSLVVWAISEGRRCAREMDRYLMGSSELPML
ncbi:MAG TPA: FAD-dependent oxidoreductase, partial [bacterium]|nr:FAD-dependent oxidoreductase [bacterium]